MDVLQGGSIDFTSMMRYGTCYVYCLLRVDFTGLLVQEGALILSRQLHMHDPYLGLVERAYTRTRRDLISGPSVFGYGPLVRGVLRCRI